MKPFPITIIDVDLFNGVNYARLIGCLKYIQPPEAIIGYITPQTSESLETLFMGAQIPFDEKFIFPYDRDLRSDVSQHDQLRNAVSVAILGCGARQDAPPPGMIFVYAAEGSPLIAALQDDKCPFDCVPVPVFHDKS